MKNLKIIKENILKSGLTGDDFKREFQLQALTFGKQLMEEIICGYDQTSFTWQDSIICLAHISDIFVQANFHDFDGDFAEHFQTEVFNLSPEHLAAQLGWCEKQFGDGVADAPNVEPVAEPDGAETGLPYPAKETAEYNERENQTLDEISRQLEMALQSDETAEGVKACLKTIIYEASNEAGLPLSDMTLIRAAFPNIIKALPKDYGRGIYHSIHSILRFDTTAFQEFYDQRLDEKPTLQKLAEQIADVLRNPLLPARIYNVLGDEIIELEDAHTPEIILANLKKLSETE